MANVIDRDIPEEFLVRFDNEGRPRGAHLVVRRQVILDGRLLQDNYLPAQPISLVPDDGNPRMMLSEVLGPMASDALIANDRMTEELKAKDAEIAGLRENIGDLSSTIAGLNGDLSAANASIETRDRMIIDLQTQLNKASAQIGAQAARIEELEPPHD